MSAFPPAVTVPPPPFTIERAWSFALGIGVPVLVAIAAGMPSAALVAGVGSLLALLTDPRRQLKVRSAAICVALAVVLAAAALGVAIRNDPTVVTLCVLAIAFLAGLPKPVFPYLTLVGKTAAAVVIITGMGLTETAESAVAFVGGGLFALAVIAIGVRWRNVDDPGTSPFDEWRAIWSGDTNPLFYAITLSATVGLGMALAVTLDAKLPGWVGLTVLFVMHPDDAMAVRNIVQRIGGTLLGIAVAAITVTLVQEPWVLAALLIACAAAMPKAQAANFFWFSLAVTVLVLLLLDLALLASGGDAPLLKWRLYDTVLGCAAVALSLGAVRGYRRLRSARSPSR